MRSRKEKREHFTVVFYVDGDCTVETYCEQVYCYSRNAFDNAVKRVKETGADVRNATEIVTFKGWPERG